MRTESCDCPPVRTEVVVGIWEQKKKEKEINELVTSGFYKN
jgi:hypothetical protein